MRTATTVPTLVVVDTGGANLGSVRYALDRLGIAFHLSDRASEIQSADKVLLPGVGHAKDSMARLADTGLVECLPTLTQPVLGICLGMQLLFKHSEEGDTQCLGIIEESIHAFDTHQRVVPHMGWNFVQAETSEHDWLPDGHYYFVHSYFAPLTETTAGRTEYRDLFSSAVHHNNFYGVQFHPERSGPLGAELLRRFVHGATST